MSLKTVSMYTVKCDGCETEAFKDHDTIAWKEKWYPRSLANETLGWIQYEGKDYCPDCWEWNEDESEEIPKSKLSE